MQFIGSIAAWARKAGRSLTGGARHRLVDVADILRNGPRFERRLFELGRDVVGAELGVGPLVPLDDKGGEPLLAAPMWSATTATASSS